MRNEDFDLAKSLKDSIERLKSIGSEITSLEDQKRIAIQNEDFDAAKTLKRQIEQLRGSAMSGNAQAPSHMGGGPPLGMGMPNSPM